jgi:RimJ/RimL family protein N-acetyltransferase
MKNQSGEQGASATDPGTVLLRRMVADDLRFLPIEPGPYNDFGPAASRAAPAPCDLEADGTLVVEFGSALAGVVSWFWMRRHWGPNEGSACVMIGISLRPEYRGRGIGTAAQRQLVERLFQHTIVHRVEAYTDVRNLAEQRSLEKAGMRREGLVRGSQFRNGVHNDGQLYSVLRTELNQA